MLQSHIVLHCFVFGGILTQVFQCAVIDSRHYDGVIKSTTAVSSATLSRPVMSMSNGRPLIAVCIELLCVLNHCMEWDK